MLPGRRREDRVERAPVVAEKTEETAGMLAKSATSGRSVPCPSRQVTVADATGCLRVVRRRCGCTAGCRRVKLTPIHGGNLPLAADAGSRTPRYSLAEGYVHLI